MSTKAASLFDRAILRQAAIDAVKKLDPRAQLRNPVMFVTLVGALLTFEQLFTSHEPFGYVLQIALWLLFTDPSLGLLSPTSQFSGVQGSTVAVGIAAVVTLILADALSSAVVAPGVARAVLGERIPVGEALRAVGSRIWQLLLLWLLTSLALTLALAPGIAAAWLGGVNGDDGVVALGVIGQHIAGDG